jgi:S-DNA-T family DNA segregation ATPase FtsK/SpoIIIE
MAYRYVGFTWHGVLIFFVLTAWLVPIVVRMVQRRKEHRAGKAAVVAASAPETLPEPAREIPVPEEIHVPVLEVEPPAGEKNTPSFEIEMAAEESTGGTMELYDPKLDLPRYRRPELSLLEDYKDKLSEVPQEELERNNQKIVECLRTYNIQIEKIVATPGPTVTLYKIVLSPGIRISQFTRLESDIMLSLAARGMRVIAPIPGTNMVGIEVANDKPSLVPMKSVLDSTKFKESKDDLPVVLGKSISNEIFMLDLARMPHLLVAGATGQGKSVALNAILASLLYKMHPAYLKLVLVDPKRVELSLYSVLEKHFLAKLPDAENAIIQTPKKWSYT